MIETFEETELSDDQLQDISGGCASVGLGLGFGGHFGGHFGGGFGFHHFGGFGFGGFAPVETFAFVPQVTQVVESVPVTQTVQTTTCGVQTVALGC